MKRIIVIDDFYNKPDEVRKIALNSPYQILEGDILISKGYSDNFYPDEL